MNTRIPLLDHGYVQLVETWGSDERIVEAARMSTDKGFQGWGGFTCTCCGYWSSYDSRNERCSEPESDGWHKPLSTGGDERLLRYLYTHAHHTPFEMAGMTIEVQAPIFVFREWHRHRTQSYNELSARYTPLPDVYYVPEYERLQLTSAHNKQAQPIADAEADELRQRQWLVELSKLYNRIEGFYRNGLSIGIPKEIARVAMPVGHYSRMRASANLRNWIAFLTLRCDAAAQYEIRQYAHAVASLVAQHFARTYELFNEQRTAVRPSYELYAACCALLNAPHPDHFASRLGDAENDAIDRIKTAIREIEIEHAARQLT